jgi:hypothetical protein
MKVRYNHIQYKCVTSGGTYYTHEYPPDKFVDGPDFTYSPRQTLPYSRTGYNGSTYTVGSVHNKTYTVGFPFISLPSRGGWDSPFKMQIRFDRQGTLYHSNGQGWLVSAQLAGYA